MKRIAIAIIATLALALSGCANMTERQKTAWAVAGGILVSGALIAASNGSGDVRVPCQPGVVYTLDGRTRTECPDSGDFANSP